MTGQQPVYWNMRSIVRRTGRSSSMVRYWVVNGKLRPDGYVGDYHNPIFFPETVKAFMESIGTPIVIDPVDDETMALIGPEEN